MYLQNAHMSVIRFDLFSQDMIFMPPASEKLREHIGLGMSVRPSVRQSDCLSVTLWQLRNSRTPYAKILKLHMWHVHEK